MSEFCEHETFKDICGICHRDARITALRAEVERLRSMTVVQETIIRKHEAENEKLRAALRDIIVDSYSVYAIDVARAALEEKQ